MKFKVGNRSFGPWIKDLWQKNPQGMPCLYIVIDSPKRLNLKGIILDARIKHQKQKCLLIVN